ncbi:MAG: purine-nucleoside phosphorylase [Myxococcota bacterium]
MTEEEAVVRAVDLLTERIGSPPEVAVVLGSGLGGFAESLEDAVDIEMARAGLPTPSVAGHGGRVVGGRLRGRSVVAILGRVHLYEGASPLQVVRTVRVMHRWGAGCLLLTNAVGGIGAGFGPGTLVVVSDHLNLQGQSPLVGQSFGNPFPDMANAYHPDLRRVLLAAADGVAPVREGVLAAMLGPSYETAAEVRMLSMLGADVVGMSTVPEVLAAAAVGLRCAVLSLVTNWATGIGADALHHEDVIAEASQASRGFVEVLERAVQRLPSS